MINRTNFPDFCDNLEIYWRKTYAEFPKRAAILYDVENVEVDTGDESGIDGYSVAKRKKEGEDFAFLNITQNYRKAWNVYEIGGMTQITWRMRKAAKYRDIMNRISNLAVSAARRLEWDLTHRFTFAADASYTNLDGETVTTTVGDGYQLAYTAHTVPGTSTTYRNIVANNPILSKGGLEAAETLFSTQMIDTNGELLSESATHLVIANNPTSINTALEYLNSVAAPEGGNSGVTNVYRLKYELVVLPYLATTAAGVYNSAKANYWFLANLNHKDAILKVLQSPTFIPPTDNGGKDFETMDWKFACHAAYAIEIIDPKWVVMSKGDASA